jgi:hypothetical protein
MQLVDCGDTNQLIVTVSVGLIRTVPKIE